jgi:hypothetical protein
MLKATSFTCKKKLQLLNFSIRYAFWRKQSRVDESMIMNSYIQPKTLPEYIISFLFYSSLNAIDVISIYRKFVKEWQWRETFYKKNI